jgi:hypothetical protein
MSGIRRKFLAAALCITLPALSALAADYTAWTGHRSIVLNTSATGANVAQDVVNFPVLIRLGANESAILGAANGGASIRFSKADNTTPLPYQIETWTSASAAIWVLVDTVRGNNSTQTIRMHWGNAAAVSESNSTAVFDTANGFRGVWHMHDSSATGSSDATVLATNALWYNGPVQTTGLIGRAVNLNQPLDLAPETAKYLMANYNTTTNNFKATSANGITLSVWVKRTMNSGGNEQGILGRYNWGSNGRQAMIALNGNDQIRLFRSTNGTNSGGAETNFGNQSIVDGFWTHIVATVRNGAQTLYVNGVQDVAQTTATIGSLDSVWATTSQLAFGRMAPDHGGNPVHQAFDGVIDEARYTVLTRSANWIKLEYENQKPVNALVDIGQPTVPGAPTAVTGIPGAVNSNTITVTWAAPASDGGTSITTYKAMAVSDTARACIASGTMNCIITGLTAGQSYTFVVRAINAIGGGALSSASPAVNAPVSILGGGAVVFNVGAFAKDYTFRLSDHLAGVTDRMVMNIIDVSGKTVWSRGVTPSQATREITWNGTTSTGARASAGIYFVRVSTVSASGKLEAVQGGVRL